MIAALICLSAISIVLLVFYFMHDYTIRGLINENNMLRDQINEMKDPNRKELFTIRRY